MESISTQRLRDLHSRGAGGGDGAGYGGNGSAAAARANAQWVSVGEIADPHRWFRSTKSHTQIPRFLIKGQTLYQKKGVMGGNPVGQI